MGPLDLRPRLQSALTHLGGQLAAKHDLRGLFGVDAILDSSNDIRPVEVNPRYTASVEILERATGDTALVPSQSRPSRVESVRPGSAIHGKAIVFARRESLVGDLYDLIGGFPFSEDNFWKALSVWPVVVDSSKTDVLEWCLPHPGSQFSLGGLD